jgi:hypothetical protein
VVLINIRRNRDGTGAMSRPVGRPSQDSVSVSVSRAFDGSTYAGSMCCECERDNCPERATHLVRIWFPDAPEETWRVCRALTGTSSSRFPEAVLDQSKSRNPHHRLEFIVGNVINRWTKRSQTYAMKGHILAHTVGH